jgi:hypothetical protein
VALSAPYSQLRSHNYRNNRIRKHPRRNYKYRTHLFLNLRKTNFKFNSRGNDALAFSFFADSQCREIDRLEKETLWIKTLEIPPDVSSGTTRLYTATRRPIHRIR